MSGGQAGISYEKNKIWFDVRNAPPVTTDVVLAIPMVDGRPTPTTTPCIHSGHR